MKVIKVKLNYEALRSAMLAFQEAPMNPDIDAIVLHLHKQGFDTEDVSYAIKQAIDSGLLSGESEDDYDGTMFLTVSDITPQGHQFIDSIVQDTHWNRVKQCIQEDGLPVTIPTISRAIAKVFLDK